MTNALEVLSTDELALVRAGWNADRFLREYTGMCGCGVVPETIHAAH